jgi:hypothetical protein
MAGGALLQPLIGHFLDQNWNGKMLNGVRIYSADNFKQSLMIVPILILVSFFIACIIKEEKKQRNKQKFSFFLNFPKRSKIFYKSKMNHCAVILEMDTAMEILPHHCIR